MMQECTTVRLSLRSWAGGAEPDRAESRAKGLGKGPVNRGTNKEPEPGSFP